MRKVTGIQATQEIQDMLASALKVLAGIDTLPQTDDLEPVHAQARRQASQWIRMLRALRITTPPSYWLPD